MRLLSLARAAWQAENLYLRRSGRGLALQAGLGAAAGIFALLMVVMLHIAGFAALSPGQGPVLAALYVAAGDLVVAAILGLLARRKPHDAIGEEALALRDASMRQMGDSAARLMIMTPLLRSSTMKKGLLGTAVTAGILAFFNRR